MRRRRRQRLVRRLLEELGGGESVIFCSFRRGVERDHLPLVDRAEMIQRFDRARVEFQPVEINGFVFREEMLVVRENHEIVFRDFRVGGIRVLQIDRSIRERGVTDRVIDPAHIPHR